ncbi:MAG: flagellar motor protein MotA [Bacteriovoracaceae bacterium]|nr:flagellar motor protein MotA [Bacteriovoracaceae bacterium]
MKNIFLMFLVGDTSASLNPLDLISQAGWVVKGVMILLFSASIISWVIIFWKWWNLRDASDDNRKFADTFWSAGTLEGAQKASKSFPKAPLTRVFESGLQEFNQIKALKLDRDHTIELMETNIVRTLNKAAAVEAEGLNSYLAFLASTASTAPFIGLFGTVWGIMTSFINIGVSGASNLAVVAPGIAEALIATAMGLFAAIPAVLFYNFFINRIRGLRSAMDNFSSDFLNTAKRNI